MEAGGCPGILNRGLIESALARPYDGWHRLIHQKAAALVHSFVKNHGFADGNKRTALYVADLLTVGAGIVSLLRRKTWKT
ncbi:MAG: Fic family protein [Gammaproteobacteria bacterium]